MAFANCAVRGPRTSATSAVRGHTIWKKVRSAVRGRPRSVRLTLDIPWDTYPMGYPINYSIDLCVMASASFGFMEYPMGYLMGYPSTLRSGDGAGKKNNCESKERELQTTCPTTSFLTAIYNYFTFSGTSKSFPTALCILRGIFLVRFFAGFPCFSAISLYILG